MEKVEWADVFPKMTAFATQDPRVFHTVWKKEGSDGHKSRQYYACVVGGLCYGAIVIRPWATSAKEAEYEALAKVVEACNNFERTGNYEGKDYTQFIPKHRREP